MDPSPNPVLNANWLAEPALGAVFDMIDNLGEQSRVVGGAVRNSLLGLPVADLDVATTALPDAVMAAAEQAGLKAVPTGIDHGTVTIVSHGQAFEVTTLREDIETHGRHATVRFGKNWQHDAERRDFTMNALYVDRYGTIHDPVGGYQDCLARRVRFIGKADDRIQEDYLRILRFFRFHAQFGRGALDAAGLSAAIRNRDGLRRLSRERIGQEVLRLIVAPKASTTVEALADAGLSPILFGGVTWPQRLSRLVMIEAAHGRRPSPAARLAALTSVIDEDVDRLADRLRLSNALREAVHLAVRIGYRLTAPAEETEMRKMLYRSDPDSYQDAVLYAWSRTQATVEDAEWRHMLELPLRWTAPRFPISGKDLLALGHDPGTAIGDALETAERRWIEGDFAAHRDEILSWIK